MNIAVIGYSGNINTPPVSEISELCISIGRKLAQLNHRIFTGGRDGVMELVAKGAHSVSGEVIGILPFEEKGNEYNSLNVLTGMDYLTRSLLIVRSCDYVISIGGEIGTLYEIVSAYACGKPVILMRGTGGWTDRITSILIDGKFLDNRRIAPLEQASSLKQLKDFLT
ncbi:MAG: TIGR00725 family protein [Kosmotoga sp.]|nr:MAG: TIGR00725 family protein [Kosmotoga sp.]